MGADVVSRRQRHHPADDRLAGRRVRPQAPADAVHRRLHARVVPLRRRRRTSASLVVFRIIQGATGGALQPLSQAVLLESFKPEERGRAMGFWGLGIVVAPILGPVVGGWLTENYSWRWVFYINLPVGIIVADHDARCSCSIRRICDASRRGIDYWGMGLLVVGIGALQFVLDKGQQEDWFESNMITTLSMIVGRHARSRSIVHAAAGRRTRSSICGSSRIAATPSACS